MGKEQEGKEFYRPAPSLSETLTKSLNNAEHQFPHPHDKNNQPRRVNLPDWGKNQRDMNRLWQLQRAVRTPTSAVWEKEWG